MRKKIQISWYIKLNILTLGFLFIMLLMKEIKTVKFQSGLEAIFSSPEAVKKEKINRPARIQVSPDK